MEPEKEEGKVYKKIKIGVCVMEKKVKCGSEVPFLFLSFMCVMSYSIKHKTKNPNRTYICVFIAATQFVLVWIDLFWFFDLSIVLLGFFSSYAADTGETRSIWWISGCPSLSVHVFTFEFMFLHVDFDSYCLVN